MKAKNNNQAKHSVHTYPHDMADSNAALFVGEFSFEVYKTDLPIITSAFPIHRLHFIKKGSVQLFYKNNIVFLPKNSIYVIIPNSSIKVLPSRNTETETYYFTFSGYNAVKILKELDLTEDNPYHIFKSKSIEKFFVEAVECKYNDFMRANLFLKNCYSIFDYIYKLNQNKETLTKSRTPNSNTIQNALIYIHKNINNPNLTITTICKEVAFMHPNSFSRLFNQTMNETFPQYLALRRCELAITLLDSGKYNITQVSDIVGYTDPLYFSRVFKKLQKIPPAEYLKKVKQRLNEKNSNS